MIFVELPLFTKHAPFTDDELAALQQTLLDNPLAGDLILGARGLRKMRAAFGGRGKRGGARVIYCPVKRTRLLLPGVCVCEERTDGFDCCPDEGAGSPGAGGDVRWMTRYSLIC